MLDGARHRVLFDIRLRLGYDSLLFGATMRILITGGHGQLGSALADVLAASHSLDLPSSAELDIAAPDACASVVGRRPDLVIHSAAFTNVDACAREPERALRVNALGTRSVALACRQLDIPLVYISTNEVFNGRASRPYLEWDVTEPINQYAYSKWAGEQLVQQLAPAYWIVRVAWVFGGQRNFVRTILRLARERGELSVVDDEIGNPTYAPDAAAAIGRLIEHPSYGVFHLTNEGYCSRWEFAREILSQAGMEHIAVRPVKLADWKRDSTPPAFAALRNFVAAETLGIRLPPWQTALRSFLSLMEQQS